MPVSQLVVDKDGNSAIFHLELLAHGFRLGVRHLQPGPTVPFELGRLGQSTETGDQASRGHGKSVGAIIGALDGDGEAVGDEKKTALDLRFLHEGGHSEERPARRMSYVQQLSLNGV